MKIPIKTIFQAASGGYSSKRVFGGLGFMTSIGIAITCTILGTQAPLIVSEILYASMALLGVDSITSIWKPKAGNIHKEETPLELDKDDQEEKL